MTAEVFRLGFDRMARGESTVVFKVRSDGVIEVVNSYWKPACDFVDQPRPNPPFAARKDDHE